MDYQLLQFVKKEIQLNTQYFAEMGVDFALLFKDESVNRFDYESIFDKLDEKDVLCKGYYKQCMLYYEEALFFYNQYHDEVDKNFMIAYLNLHFQKYDKFTEICKKYLDINEFKVMLMSFYIVKDMYNECLEVGMGDDNSHVRRKCAVALFNIGKKDEALKILNENIENGDIYSYRTLGMLIKNKDIIMKSIDLGVTIAIPNLHGLCDKDVICPLLEKHADTSALLYLDLGIMYKKVTKEMADIGNLGCINNYAMQLEEKGEYDEAIKYVKKLMRYGINTIGIYYFLIRIYDKLGDENNKFDSALEGMRKFREKDYPGFLLSMLYYFVDENNECPGIPLLMEVDKYTAKHFLNWAPSLNDKDKYLDILSIVKMRNAFFDQLKKNFIKSGSSNT